MNPIKSHSFSDHLSETLKSMSIRDNGSELGNQLGYGMYYKPCNPENINNYLIEDLKINDRNSDEIKESKPNQRRYSTLSKQDIEPNIQLSFLSNEDKIKKANLPKKSIVNKTNKVNLNNNPKNSCMKESKMSLPTAIKKIDITNKNINKENNPDFLNKKDKQIKYNERIPLRKLTKEPNNSVQHNKSNYNSNKSELIVDIKVKDKFLNDHQNKKEFKECISIIEEKFESLTEKNFSTNEKNIYLIEKIDCIKNLVNLEKKSLNLKMKREIDTIENIQIYKNDEEIVESLLKNGNQFIYLR